MAKCQQQRPVFQSSQAGETLLLMLDEHSIFWGSCKRRRGISYVGFIFTGNSTEAGRLFTQTQGGQQIIFVEELKILQLGNPTFNSKN